MTEKSIKPDTWKVFMNKNGLYFKCHKPIVILLALFFSLSSYAIETYRSSRDFKLIKLNKNLKNRANALFKGNTHFESDPVVSKAIKSFKSSDQDIIFQQTNQLKSLNSPFERRNPSNELNPLYQQILEYLVPRYENIGDTNANQVLKFNDEFNLGVQNYSGFQWQKPIGTVTLGVDRQIAPDFQDDDVWIVRDYFYLSINAHTYFKNLADNGEISMSDETLAAFVGVQFTRVYSYTHLASSYREALTKNYDKLFLMFLYFRGEDLNKLDDYDIITKADYYSFNAGGVIVLPTSSGIGFSAGALAKLNKMSQITVQKLGPEDAPLPEERVRINFEKEVGKSVVANAAVVADLFNFLRFTLLSFEYSFEFAEAKSIMLSVYDEDLAGFKSQSSFALEIYELFKLNDPKEDVIAHRIVSKSQRIKEMQSSKYVALLLGGIHKRLSEYITIQKNNLTKSFFKHNSKNIKFVKAFWKNIFNKLIASWLKLEPITSYKYSRTRNLNIEYESERDVLNKKEVLLDANGKLSFKLKNETFHTKVRGMFNRRYKKYLLNFMKNFTTLDSDITKAVKKGQLRGPIEVKSNIIIDTKAISFINENRNLIPESLNDICKTYKRSVRKKCQKRLLGAYQSFNDSSQNEDVNLWYFKDFAWNLTKYMASNEQLKDIFGEKNIFIHGSFTGKSKKGRSQLFFFKDGNYNNNGVIDIFANQIN